MWKRPLNSAILVAAIHRKLGRAFDRTSTRVVAYIIKKWWAEISQKRLYNVRDPTGIRESSWENQKNTIIQRTEIIIKFKKNILQNYSPWTLLRNDFFA